MTRELAVNVLETASRELGELPAFTEEALEIVLRPMAEELELKTGQLFGTLRSAVTGREIAPPLFQTMAVLGKERCLKRMQEALVLLEKVRE
jgi:glutamyl-tRNA synthetase